MNRRLGATFTALIVSIATVATIVFKPPIRYVWNVSDSVPVGLYQLTPIDSLYVNELVAVRTPEPLAAFLDDAGYLPRGLPMLKHISALAGQIVCRRGATMSVDGIAVGEAHERDRRGRLLPVWQGCRVIPDGDVFLMHPQSADSLDGRYFGVLPVTAIFAEAKLVWSSGER